MLTFHAYFIDFTPQNAIIYPSPARTGASFVFVTERDGEGIRIAVCTSDMDARHALSRLADDALLRRGVLPELTLFPILPELLAVMAASGSPFDVGARYFIENPVNREKIDRAIARCLNKKEIAI